MLFDVEAARARAVEALSKAPPFAWIDRPMPRGDRVASFVIPLELLPTTNRTRGAQAWAIGKLKKNLFAVMWRQCGRIESPLNGRPMVRAIRFSSVAPDACSDWAKMAVDMLCVRTARATKRLGIIVDDRPEAADVRQHWEPAPKGAGFVIIEVFEGTL